MFKERDFIQFVDLLFYFYRSLWKVSNETTKETAGGDIAKGEIVYKNNCLSCHGNQGVNGHNGPNLQTSAYSKSVDSVISKVTNGGAVMPSFEDALTEEQIKDVSAYVHSLAKE